jgi:hypothetical protein
MKLFGNMLQDRPLHVRRRIALIATSTITVILLFILIWVYIHPQPVRRDPEHVITAVYTTILNKVQSLFSSK